jgi:hypothetical protein
MEVMKHMEFFLFMLFMPYMVHLFVSAQLKLTGSMSTASVTPSGSFSGWMICASSRLNALIARVRSMIW